MLVGLLLDYTERALTGRYLTGDLCLKILPEYGRELFTSVNNSTNISQNSKSFKIPNYSSGTGNSSLMKKLRIENFVTHSL